jgi:hypothetical protein
MSHFAGDAGARDLGALVADVLALLVTERGEELLEAAPASAFGGLVPPMKLPVKTVQPAGRIERFCIRTDDEIGMCRRQAGALDCA